MFHVPLKFRDNPADVLDFVKEPSGEIALSVIWFVEDAVRLVVALFFNATRRNPPGWNAHVISPSEFFGPTWPVNATAIGGAICVLQMCDQQEA